MGQYSCQMQGFLLLWDDLVISNPKTELSCECKYDYVHQQLFQLGWNSHIYRLCNCNLESMMCFVTRKSSEFRSWDLNPTFPKVQGDFNFEELLWGHYSVSFRGKVYSDQNLNLKSTTNGRAEGVGLRWIQAHVSLVPCYNQQMCTPKRYLHKAIKDNSFFFERKLELSFPKERTVQRQSDLE